MRKISFFFFVKFESYFLFSRVPMRMFFGFITANLITSVALEKCLKKKNTKSIKSFWCKVFCELKIKIT